MALEERIPPPKTPRVRARERTDRILPFVPADEQEELTPGAGDPLDRTRDKFEGAISAALASIGSGRLNSFPTVADLREGNFSGFQHGSVVSVSGYYEPGDGGGGDYYVDTEDVSSADDGGSVIVADHGDIRLKAIFSGAVPVERFGALGDGVTDSTAQIQRTIEYAESLPEIGGVVATKPVTLGRGRFVVSNLEIESLAEFSGISGQLSDFNNGTILFHKAGSSGPLLNVSPVGGVPFRKPYVHDMVLLGQAETNASGKVSLSSVTSRTSFFVAVGDLPDEHVAGLSWPFYGHCFFYSSEDRYIGSGWVEAIDFATGEVTLRAGTDWYATPTGSGLLLTTDCKVIFSPLSTFGSWTGYSGAFASAGGTGIQVNGTGAAKLKNLLVEKFHCGIVVTDGANLIGASELFVRRSQFFNLGIYRAGVSSDSLYHTGYLQGYYRRDYDLAEETTEFDNYLLRRTTFNIYLPGYFDQFEQFVCDGAVCNVLQALSTDVTFGNLLLDNAPVGGYWVDGPAAKNAFRVSGLVARSLFLTATAAGEPAQLLTAPPERFVVKVSANTPTDATIGTICVHDVYSRLNNDPGSPLAPLYDVVFNVASGNQVTYSSAEGGGFRGATAYKSSGSVSPRSTGIIEGNTTVADIGSNWFRPGTHSVAYSANAVELFRIDTTGIRLGESALLTPALEIIGGASGTALFKWTRTSGVSQNYTVHLGGGTWRLVDGTAGYDALWLQTNGGAVTMYFGSASGSASPKGGTISGEAAVGTDLPAAAFTIQAGAGTGSSTSQGRIGFRTPDATVSGTTTQSQTEKVAVEREGQFSLHRRSADPTVNTQDGQLWFRTDLAFVRTRVGGSAANLVDSSRSGTAGLVAGVAAVANTAVTAATRVFVNRKVDVGTVADSYSVAANPGVGFTITAMAGGVAQTLDTSTVSYLLIEP